jgi:hypothetical protein
VGRGDVGSGEVKVKRPFSVTKGENTNRQAANAKTRRKIIGKTLSAAFTTAAALDWNFMVASPAYFSQLISVDHQSVWVVAEVKGSDSRAS